MVTVYELFLGIKVY